MVKLPARVRVVRRNETRSLTKPIEAALNAIPGVWACRNLVGSGYHRNGDPATWGLGTGSADIVFGLDIYVQSSCVQRLGWLEVKWPGKKPRPSQREWHEGLSKRCRGHFMAVVHSVSEAIEAVERCRKGEGQ